MEGKANLLTKLVGDVDVKGNIEASKSELYEKHEDVDQYQIDMYFMWVSRQTIMLDKTLPTCEKLSLWREARPAFEAKASAEKPIHDPNTLYQFDEPIGEVQPA